MNNHGRARATPSALALATLVCSAWAAHGSPVYGGESAELAAGEPESAPLNILEGRASIIEGSAPVWASAEAATTPDGNVNWELLGERARSVYESVARQPPLPLGLVHQMPEASGVFYETGPDGEIVAWLRYGPGSHEEPGGRLDTLRRVADLATGIYLGEVVGVEEGFLLGDVGSLLRIRTERVVLPSDAHRTAAELYLFWPEAKFSIGNLHFWKENPAYPDRPAVGSRVLVVADRRVPFDTGRKLVLPRPEAVFVESSGRGLEVSEKVVTSAERSLPSLEEVAAELERLLEQDPEGVP